MSPDSGGFAAADDEIMAFGLAANGLDYRGIKTRFTVLAQGGGQIGIIILSQTHIKLTRTGYPHTVTGFTEIMRKRRDKAKLASPSLIHI